MLVNSFMNAVGTLLARGAHCSMLELGKEGEAARYKARQAPQIVTICFSSH